MIENEEVKKPKSKKKKILSVGAFVLFNIIAIAVVLILELDSETGYFASMSDVVAVISANMIYFVMAIMCYVIHVLCDAIAYFALIKKCGYGNRVWLAVRIAILGKYYDNITPWNTGGQPFQMAYMIKANIDGPTACSLPLIKYSIRVLFFDLIVIILFSTVNVDVSGIILAGAIFSSITCTILPLILLIFSNRVDIVLKYTKKLVALGTKLKLVKNYEKTLAKAEDQVDSFLAAIKYLGKHKEMVVVVGGVTAVDTIALLSIPFFIIKALGGTAVSFIETITIALYVQLASGVAPTPGAAGASEASFYSVFSDVVPDGFTFWAVLFWRILIFYLPLALGVITLITDWLSKRQNVELVKREIVWMGRKTLKKNGKTEVKNTVLAIDNAEEIVPTEGATSESTEVPADVVSEDSSNNEKGDT